VHCHHLSQVLLPDNRHLKHFDQQPLASLPEGKEGARYLLWWYLEDQVKVGGLHMYCCPAIAPTQGPEWTACVSLGLTLVTSVLVH
jgi:hypothetical protein